METFIRDTAVSKKKFNKNKSSTYNLAKCVILCNPLRKELLPCKDCFFVLKEKGIYRNSVHN